MAHRLWSGAVNKDATTRCVELRVIFGQSGTTGGVGEFEFARRLSELIQGPLRKSRSRKATTKNTKITKSPRSPKRSTWSSSWLLFSWGPWRCQVCEPPSALIQGPLRKSRSRKATTKNTKITQNVLLGRNVLLGLLCGCFFFVALAVSGGESLFQGVHFPPLVGDE